MMTGSDMKHSILAATMMVASMTLAVPAQASVSDDLHCVESHFQDEDLAKMGAHFAEIEEGASLERSMAEGRAAAYSSMADAVDDCAAFSAGTGLKLETAVEYLKRLSIVRELGFSNGIQWNLAMETYAQSGSKLVPSDGELSEHKRAMIVAGAHGNGVPKLANDDEEKSDIITYLRATNALEDARSALQN